MHAFRVAFDQGWLVVDDLPQARKTDHPECFARACAGGNIDGDSLDWRFLFAVNDCVSTLRFAFHRKSRRKRLTKLARNIEKLCGSSAFELKLDLAQPL